MESSGNGLIRGITLRQYPGGTGEDHGSFSKNIGSPNRTLNSIPPRYEEEVPIQWTEIFSGEVQNRANYLPDS